MPHSVDDFVVAQVAGVPPGDRSDLARGGTQHQGGAQGIGRGLPERRRRDVELAELGDVSLRGFPTGKPWEKHGKIGKSEENHRKTIGK